MVILEILMVKLQLNSSRSHEARCGLKHGCLHIISILKFALPASLLALLLMTLPACLVLTYVGDQLLVLTIDHERDFDVDEGSLPLNYFAWSSQIVRRLPDMSSFLLMNGGLREICNNFVACASWV
eukprot:TRINITY_DN20208_c0_g2_i1.p1 TRINITY_DN20208_c0_g2~~TRINITY_DN20208_c0_g2_i1.p1  ORF type:complete len:139 (+),score=11.69 TRINITY_DN20208_c0_g2_i1:40-417(+)